MRLGLRALLTAVASLLGCAPGSTEGVAGADAVVVDTSTEAARAQYDANVAFALRYAARCKATTDRKRVLVAGFGRVYGEQNPAGQVVSALVPGLRYPVTTAPGGGRVDPPEPQLAVAQGTLDLATSGKVEACGMVIPAAWDLTAVLVAKEIEAFKPDFVIMNGIGRARAAVWIELGAVNRALPHYDESDVLKPAPAQGEEYAPLVKADPLGNQQGLLLSYARVRASAEGAVRELSSGRDGEAFGRVVLGVGYPRYPRATGNYLCNNLSYVTSWLMAHPGEDVTLLEASVPKKGAVNAVTARIEGDFRQTPRVFVHWPSEIGGHLAEGAKVLGAMIDAQLSAAPADAPTYGDLSMVDIEL
jgi:hypothetical protein